VKTLGNQMSSNGIRWLSASRDSKERILYYHRWMNVEIASSFLANVELEEKTLAPELVRNFADNVDALITYVDKAFPQSSAIRLGYRTLLSERAARTLGRQDLSDEERLYWISKLSTATGFSSAYNYIQDDVLKLPVSDKARLHVYLERFMVLSRRLRSDSQNQPFWLINLNGDTAQILTMRAVYLMEPLSDAEFHGLMDSMQFNDLQALSSQWMAKLPKEAYLNEYLRLTGLFVNELKERELVKEANDMARFFVKIAAPARARERMLEGTYKLHAENGKDWIFTAAFARGTEVYVGLTDSNGFVSKSFFFLSYVEAEDAFIASERERAEDPFRNWAVKFKMNKDGSIIVTDLSASKGEQVMRGKKVQSFPNYFPKSKPGVVSPAGRYEGIILGKKMTLEVTGYNGLSTAQMYDEEHNMNFDLNVGTVGTDGVLYLTTGVTNRTSWIQLRGYLENGAYRGVMIKGGQGLIGKEFVLKKVSK